ncbi:hypothetical protein [Allokutzneria albata]|uniref:Uncharacterized protein n=1 Tax=Allokutzneria albata TaxID=211114 RepID=A0A1G9SXQ8_ALLAB|nr:hypothetical protein [Allokutzneria albata]SDM40248.1 hypothetical protein SAMN04489726_1442 [Allokutzneria albata]
MIIDQLRPLSAANAAITEDDLLAWAETRNYTSTRQRAQRFLPGHGYLPAHTGREAAADGVTNRRTGAT